MGEEQLFLRCRESLKKLANMRSTTLILVLIFCYCTTALPQQTPLQVDVTKTVQCSDNEKASEGDKVTVHYGGFLMNGTKFDSSFDRARPFTFELGVGQVIPGWDQGLLGVCPKEERHLVVPSDLAYGNVGLVKSFHQMPSYCSTSSLW